MNGCLYIYIYKYTHISLKLLKRQAGVRPGWRLVAIDSAEEGAAGAEELPEWQSRLKALSDAMDAMAVGASGNHLTLENLPSGNLLHSY